MAKYFKNGVYYYGWRYKGYLSIVTLPKDGLIESRDDIIGTYTKILLYNRKLNESEILNNDLEFIKEDLRGC